MRGSDWKLSVIDGPQYGLDDGQPPIQDSFDSWEAAAAAVVMIKWGQLHSLLDGVQYKNILKGLENGSNSIAKTLDG